MAKIEKHISELLHDNDCVIVPKMGGFLSSQPFSGNHTFKLSSGTFSKKISFNVLLNYNDGLLANHMVKHSKLSYDEALLEIEKFVDEIHHVTDSGGKFKIDQVGILYKDAERNIQIEPFMNLDHPTDPPVNSDPKPFSAATETKQADIINPKTLFISHPLIINKKKSSVFRKTKFIFLVFLIAAGILTSGFWFYFSSTSQSNLASINSNDSDLTVRSGINDLSSSKSEPGTQPVNPPVVRGTSKESSATVAETGNMKSGISSGSINVPADGSDNGHYYIIAGSFRSSENAKKKLDELKLHGFKNAQIFSDSRNLQLVSYDRFNTHDDANEKMKSIILHYKEAWIYHQ